MVESHQTDLLQSGEYCVFIFDGPATSLFFLLGFGSTGFSLNVLSEFSDKQDSIPTSRMHTAFLPTISRGIPGPMSRDRWLPTPWTYLPDPGHTYPQKEADTRDTHSQKGHGTRDTPQTKQTYV